ncbi:hypothetical protein JW921_09745 [Candidatus Fermentibacterales bacterium]|nr:hypothetical protein [Candidatus Fermentibacterales bacterium]
MTGKFPIAAWAAAILAAVLAGCAQGPEMSDDDYIYQLLWQSDVAGMSALDGYGGTDGGDRDVAVPQSWYRQQTSYGGFSVQLENDPAMGVCTVTVSHGLVGELLIDVVWDDTLDYGEKPVNVMRTRRAIVERREESTQYGGWVLTHITAADYLLQGSVQQEVSITSMRFYVDGELAWECDDPGAFYDVETGLPELSEGQLVSFEATASHSSPVYVPEFFVYVHGPCPVWPRHLMYDDGNYGDQTAGDGIYTYQWHVEDTLEDWGIAADVVDADTFADQTEEDYDSGAWGMPVRRI